MIRTDYERVALAVAPVRSQREIVARSQRDDAKFAVRASLAEAYRGACGWLTGGAVTMVLVRFGMAARRRFRGSEDDAIVAAGLALGALTFLILLAIVYASSLRTLFAEYFAVAYPLALLFAGIVSAVELPASNRFVSQRRTAILQGGVS